MDDQRVGLIVRALRRRLGWRQADVARTAECSQGLVSLVERGHLDRVSIRTLRRILAALDASLVYDVRWRGGALDRLLDEDHARLLGVVADRLRSLGWDVRTEITYSEFGERGSYDILAWHAATRSLLIIEIKTEVPSLEATLRKIDEKVRLAPKVCGERFGWRASQISRLLVMPDERTLRRRVERHASVLNVALPDRGVAVRRWIASPSGNLAGLTFVTDRNRRSRIQNRGGRERVRRGPSSVRAPNHGQI